MTTFVGTEVAFETMLSNLIQLNFDAAAAYQAAIDRLETPRFKAAMLKFKADHLRHTQELGACLREMGHEAPREGDAKQLLTTGKVLLAGLVGDAAIVTAMRTNEDDTVTAYDRAVAHPDCPENLLAVLKRGQADESRHRDWMIAALTAKKPKRARSAVRRPASRPARQKTRAKAARPKRATRAKRASR